MNEEELEKYLIDNHSKIQCISCYLYKGVIDYDDKYREWIEAFIELKDEFLNTDERKYITIFTSSCFEVEDTGQALYKQVSQKINNCLNKIFKGVKNDIRFISTEYIV